MKDRKRQNGRGDASDIGVIRVFSNPGPDAEDRLRRLFTLLLKPSVGDGQAESEKDSPLDNRNVDDNLEAEA